MTEQQRVLARGLEGVIAGRTANSTVDGQNGVLIYKGYDIHDLAPNCGYEEVLYLLWHEDLPNRDQLERLKQAEAAEREMPDAVYELIDAAPDTAHPMSILQAAAAMLGVVDPETEDAGQEANRRKAVRAVGRFPTIIAHVDRFRRGVGSIQPRKDLGRAANFLHMLHGREPKESHARALDLYWVLTIDHGYGNASTFASRVVASTLPDLYSAISAAVGALKGPLHGGAPTDVLEVLEEVGSPERVENFVKEWLDAGRRIPGIGHRVYKTWDPRVRHLEETSRRLAREAPDPELFELAKRLEEVSLEALRRRKPDYALYPNVEFFTATLQHYIGIPGYLFGSMFAASRVGGWTAHVLEQQADNRLIRPRGEYTGPRRREFVPLDQR